MILALWEPCGVDFIRVKRLWLYKSQCKVILVIIKWFWHYERGVRLSQSQTFLALCEPWVLPKFCFNEGSCFARWGFSFPSITFSLYETLYVSINCLFTSFNCLFGRDPSLRASTVSHKGPFFPKWFPSWREVYSRYKRCAMLHLPPFLWCVPSLWICEKMHMPLSFIGVLNPSSSSIPWFSWSNVLEVTLLVSCLLKHSFFS